MSSRIIPTSVLALVLGALTVKCVFATCRLVCTRWNSTPAAFPRLCFNLGRQCNTAICQQVLSTSACGALRHLILSDGFFLNLLTLPRWPNLETLQLRHMNLQTVHSSNLAFLAFMSFKLWKLDLYDDECSDKDVTHIACLHGLRHLQLRSCRISDECLSCLRALMNLEHLQLRGCPQITNKGLHHLEALRDLQYLGLAYTSVSDVSRLRVLPKLLTLDLENTPVTNSSLLYLGGTLTALSIRRCHCVTDEGLFNVARACPDLKVLRHGENGEVTHQARNEVARLLPTCKIRQSNYGPPFA
jgi:hypothetical protein